MKTRARLWLLVWLCGAATVLPACGSSDQPMGTPGSGGTGGSTGSGGSSGSSGSSGSAGTGTPDAAPPTDSGPQTDGSPCTAGDIAGKLACIPGLTVRELTMDGGGGGVRQFEIYIDQPVDHMNPSGQRFAQRLRLRHRDETLPMVLAASGYSLSTGATELGNTFGTNTLQVEHRYFAPSIPAAPVDWKLLNIKQSAADFHAITLAFKTIYKAKWVNTGASKGGMTSVYHRRFYPADLDATVAYVAPNMLSLEDQRFPAFLRTVGGDMYAACRESLNQLQKTVLTRRTEIEAAMSGTYDSLGGKAIALEHATLEMPFTFWQYQNPTSTTNGCSAIPAPDAPQMTLYRFFSTVAVLSNFSDMGYAGFAPYYYQATNQLGAPAVEDAHLAGLLQHRETYRPSHYIPKGVEVPPWDAEAMVDVQNWVKTDGKTIMFIYGEYDPWTAAEFEVGNAVDSHRFVAPGGNHGANLARLSTADRAQALTILQGWLGVPPVLPFDAIPVEEDENFRPRL